MIECPCEIQGSLLSCSVLLFNPSLIATKKGKRKIGIEGKVVLFYWFDATFIELTGQD